MAKRLSLQQIIWRCIKAPEQYVMRIDYRGDESTTRRIISPTKYGPKKRTVFALCFAREEIRQFRTDRIIRFEAVSAHEVVMPTAAVIVCPECGAIKP